MEGVKEGVIEENIPWMYSGGDSIVERPRYYASENSEVSSPIPLQVKQTNQQKPQVIDEEYQNMMRAISQNHVLQHENEEYERLTNRCDELKFNLHYAKQTIQIQEKILEKKSDLSMETGLKTQTTEVLLRYKESQIEEMLSAIEKAEKVGKTLLTIIQQCATTGKLPDAVIAKVSVLTTAVDGIPVPPLPTPTISIEGTTYETVKTKLKQHEGDIQKIEQSLESEWKLFEGLKKEQREMAMKKQEDVRLAQLKKKKEAEDRRRIELEERERALYQRKRLELEQRTKESSSSSSLNTGGGTYTFADPKKQGGSIWDVFEEEDVRRSDQIPITSSVNLLNDSSSSSFPPSSPERRDQIDLRSETSPPINNNNNNNNNNNTQNDNEQQSYKVMSHDDLRKLNDDDDDRIIFLSQEESDDFIKKTSFPALNSSNNNNNNEDAVSPRRAMSPRSGSGSNNAGNDDSTPAMRRFLEDLEKENKPKHSEKKKKVKINIHFTKDQKSLSSASTNKALSCTESTTVTGGENSKGGYTTTTNTNKTIVFNPFAHKQSSSASHDRPDPNAEKYEFPSHPEVIRIVVSRAEFEDNNDIDAKCKIGFGSLKKSTLPLSKSLDFTWNETFYFPTTDKEVRKIRSPGEMTFTVSANESKKSLFSDNYLGKGVIYLNEFKLNTAVSKGIPLRNKMGDIYGKLYLIIHRTNKKVAVPPTITAVSPPRTIVTKQSALMSHINVVFEDYVSNNCNNNNNDSSSDVNNNNNLNALQIVADKIPPNLDEIATLLEDGKYDYKNNWKNRRDQTYLHLMVQHQNKELVNKLAAVSDLNARDYNGYTPLHIASLLGNIDIVKNLLQAGAPVNAQEVKLNTKITPLQLASFKGHTEVVDVLLNFNAIVDDTDREGGTALMKASAMGHLECIKVLLKSKPPIDAEDNEGYTAILYALAYGENRVASFLLGAGARCESSIEDESPLFLSLVNNNMVLFNAFSKKLLVGQVRSGRYHQSLLHRAIMHFEEDQSNELLSKLLSTDGIDVNIRNKMQQPPLFYAVHFNRIQTISLLKQKGNLDIHLKDTNGNNVFHFANSVSMISLLVELLKTTKQADYTPNFIEVMVNTPNLQGNTPLHTAYAFANSSVVDMFKSLGADESVKNKFSNSPSSVVYAARKKLLPFYNTDPASPSSAGLYIGRVTITFPSDLVA